MRRVSKTSKGQESIRYYDWVDFRPQVITHARNSCIGGNVYTIAPTTGIKDFWNDLIASDAFRIFHIGSRPLDKSERHWISFEPRNLGANDMIRGLDKLLLLLNARKLPIIWKEGQFGYEIDYTGCIKRSWELLLF